MSRRREPHCIVITGATGGIGGALAAVYAAPGNRLILQGRNEQRLRELTAICNRQGAQVLTQVLDLSDRHARDAWLHSMMARERPDLVIVNAGVNTDIGPLRAGEDWPTVERLIEVNVVAAMATVDAALPVMRARGSGQIALISSLAAYYGLPLTPSYCASKAALKAYGEALRGWLAGEGIAVSVVMPGYVESAMCNAMPGPKPFLWPAERAAQRIRRDLARNRARVSFPFPLNLGTWLLSALPPAISQRVLRLLGYGG